VQLGDDDKSFRTQANRSRAATEMQRARLERERNSPQPATRLSID
jgi:hypothetical protein